MAIRSRPCCSHLDSTTMQARLGVGEHVFTYLDDIHTVSSPTRMNVAHSVVEEEL